MAQQPFEVVAAELLPGVERLVVANHAALYRDALGKAWTPAAAYRWIRYEDPDPVGRLVAATLRLEEEWAGLGAGAETQMRAASEERSQLADLTEAARPLGFSG